MTRSWITAAVTAGVSIAALGLCAGHAVGNATASAQLTPLRLTEAGVDGHRHPFVRWDPAWPLVNILVSTRPVRSADGTPALRYWVRAGFYDALSDGPERVWRSDDPLIPGVYYTAISGDAAFEHSPFTPFMRITVRPKRGEWTRSDLAEALHPLYAPRSAGPRPCVVLDLRTQ